MNPDGDESCDIFPCFCDTRGNDKTAYLGDFAFFF